MTQTQGLTPPRADGDFPRRWWTGAEPAHVVIALLSGAFVWLTAQPVSDIDAYWHVLIGREILETGRIGGLGNGWSLYEGGAGWTTTQWLSEVAMAAVVDTFGWRGLIALRLALVLILVALIARLVLPRCSPWAGAATMSGVLLALVGVIQDRPLLAGLIFITLLSGWTYDLLVGKRTPRWVVVLPVAILWANLHGSWILGPLSFGVVGALLLTRPDRRSHAHRAFLLAGAFVAAACVTPVGARNLVLPLGFIGATDNLAEWQPTVLWDPTAAGLLVLVAAVLTPWLRHSPDRLVSAYAAAWFLFALPNVRNVAPASLMLAPVSATALTLTIRRRARPLPSVEAKILATVAVAALVSLVGLTVARYMTMDPLARAEPRLIAERLAETDRPLRVWNAYNASGALAYFSEGRLLLAVDGRADRFGGEYIGRLVDAQVGKGDIETLLADISPDVVVMGTDTGLTRLLVERGWRIALEDGQYSLLYPPQDA
jgi:hypothetical protein